MRTAAAEAKAVGVSSSAARLWVLRLQPGDDLVDSIMDFARRNSNRGGRNRHLRRQPRPRPAAIRQSAGVRVAGHERASTSRSSASSERSRRPTTTCTSPSPTNKAKSSAATPVRGTRSTRPRRSLSSRASIGSFAARRIPTRRTRSSRRLSATAPCARTPIARLSVLRSAALKVHTAIRGAALDLGAPRVRCLASMPRHVSMLPLIRLQRSPWARGQAFHVFSKRVCCDLNCGGARRIGICC